MDNSNEMRFVLLSAWVLGIVLFSVAPIEFKDVFHTRGHLHDAGHFASFLVTAILFCWGIRALLRRAAVCCGLVVLAVLVEGLEVMIYHHHYEWSDVAVDSAGIIAGLLLTVAMNLLSRTEVS